MRIFRRNRPVDLLQALMDEAEALRPTPKPTPRIRPGARISNLRTPDPYPVTKQYVDNLMQGGMVWHSDRPVSPKDGDCWIDKDDRTMMWTGGGAVQFVWSGGLTGNHNR